MVPFGHQRVQWAVVPIPAPEGDEPVVRADVDADVSRDKLEGARLDHLMRLSLQLLGQRQDILLDRVVVQACRGVEGHAFGQLPLVADAKVAVDAASPELAPEILQILLQRAYFNHVRPLLGVVVPDSRTVG